MLQSNRALIRLVMKTDNAVLRATIADILAAGTSMAASNAWAVPDQLKNWEKCAGQAKFDNADHEWVYVPQGSCSKITGGRVAAVKPGE
jgi:uncharacterized membrane protein